MTKIPSSLQWYKWRAGALSEEERAAFEEAVAGHPELQERLEESTHLAARLRQRAGFDALLQEGAKHCSPAVDVPEDKGIAEASSKERFAAWWAAWAPVATAYVLLVGFVSWTSMQPPQTSPPGVARSTQGRGFVAKSIDFEFGMLYMKKGTNKSYRASRRQVLHSGDLVQFFYKAGRAGYAMIASLNAKGVVSRYVPYQSKRGSLAISVGKGVLPASMESLELDDTVGAERIFFVFGERPFSYQGLKRALEASFAKSQHIGRIRQIPGPWNWKSMTIIKGAARRPNHRKKRQ